MFYILRPDSWETTRLCAKHLIRWAFRGQGGVSWSLEISLHRNAQQFGLTFNLLHSREMWMLKEFQRRAHHYISDPPPMNQPLEWLALIQHHGGPTRLLDFTHSFYVAAFFALEGAMQDVAVWAVRLESLEKAFREKLNLGERPADENISTLNTKLVAISESYISAQADDKLVIHVEPERMNQRLSIQQGLFLFPFDIKSSFMANLAATFDMPADIMTEQKEIEISQMNLQQTFRSIKASVLQIIIPRRSIYTALSDLRSMNVTSATLFPGLDGFARSMSQHLRMFPVGNKEDEFFDRFISREA